MMADPTKYVPGYDFSDYQATNPADPLPGTQVDIELANIAQANGQAVDAIKDVRRSDGKLKNGIVTPDSLSAGTQALFTNGEIDVDSAFVPSLTGADAVPVRTVLEREVQGMVGDLSADNTAVLEAAWEKATGTVYENITGELSFMDMAAYDMKLPPGRFLYTGTGLEWLTQAPIILKGAGSHLTEIVIPDGVYFIDLVDNVAAIHVEGIKFRGGKGVYRNTATANNVGGRRVWRDCIFSLYTECAINENSQDGPNFEATGNIFVGKGGEPTIGIALSGYTDISVIRRNMFLRNKINIKFQTAIRSGQNDLGPAPNVYIGENDMTRFVGSDTPTIKVADIWIEPNPEISINAGYGLTIERQKFGNENYISGQYKILVADVDRNTGSDNGSQHVHKTTKSDGYLSLLQVDNCLFQYVGTNYVEPAPIYSFARRVDGLHFGAGNKIAGNPPAMTALQYDDAALFDGVRRNALSLIHVGPSEEDSVRRERVSNGGAIVVDPLHAAQSDRRVPKYHHAGIDEGAISLLTSSLVSGATLSDATLSAVTDSLGGSNATEITFSSQDGFATLEIGSGSMRDDIIVWAEIDVLVGASNPLAGVQIGIRDSGGVFQVSRAVEPPQIWRTFLVPWVTPNPGGSWRLDIRPAPGDFAAGVATKVKIGRPRVYHADNPVNFGNIRTFGSGRWDGGHVRTQNWSLFGDSANRLRVKLSGGAVGSDTDGSIIKNYASGTTAQRPATNNFVGREFFDTTLGKPIYWNGSNWSDAAGTTGV